MRFIEVWPRAPTLPTMIVIAASTARAGAHTLAVLRCSATSKQAQEGAERRRLRRDRHEGRDRGRRALVDVGRPLVKRRDRRLEGEPDHAQREPGEQQRVGAQAVRLIAAAMPEKSVAPVAP